MEVLVPEDPAGMPAPLLDPGTDVVLAGGTTVDLKRLSREELLRLQWEQERFFAREILAAPKGSLARAEATRRAYETVTRLFLAQRGTPGGPVTLGFHPRYQRLVLAVLARQRRRGMPAGFFEIGYGNGVLLKRVSEAGYPVAGIEVSLAMQRQARQLLGPQHAEHLHVGDFLRCEFPESDRRASLVYWNDVFEHIPPDEICEYLTRIFAMLLPGGALITITPNWHVRPSDVTGLVRPPRTESAGLHLKEYTLREVTRLLRASGFCHVATPLVVLPRRVVLCGRGLAGAKRLAEPALELLPFRLARLLCRGFGLSMTIAQKPADFGAGRRRCRRSQ